MTYNVSLDPSLNRTGFCVWDEEGKLVDKGVLRTNKDSDELEKALELVKKFNDLCDKWVEKGEINTVAVEKWQKHTNRAIMLSMMKCALSKGLLIAIGRLYGDVIEVSKGSIKKEESKLLAASHGVKGAKDMIDAWHLGMIAGFGRNSVKKIQKK